MRGEIAGFLVRAGALVALWIGIVAVGTDSAEYRPWLLAACALYFALYFLVPLFFPGEMAPDRLRPDRRRCPAVVRLGGERDPFSPLLPFAAGGPARGHDRDKIPTAAGVALASLFLCGKGPDAAADFSPLFALPPHPCRRRGERMASETAEERREIMSPCRRIPPAEAAGLRRGTDRPDRGAQPHRPGHA